VRQATAAKSPAPARPIKASAAGSTRRHSAWESSGGRWAAGSCPESRRAPDSASADISAAEAVATRKPATASLGRCQPSAIIAAPISATMNQPERASQRSCAAGSTISRPSTSDIAMVAWPLG